MSLEVCIEKRVKGFILDVQFAVNGQSTGILGASGSGKSMTLRCIAGIETPDRGRIVINDRVLFDSERNINLSPQKRNVGYLFQSYALFPHMTIEQNIGCALPSSADKADRKAERIAQLSTLFRLNGLESRYPNQLSGGQQQRVALARMLASQPSALLFDEPFSALDTCLKEEIQLELLQLMREYAGDVVMVTHSRDEAYQLCEQLMIVNDGTICESGQKKELFDHPAQTVTARLTGCKNIEKATPINDNEVFVESWDAVLQVAAPIPAGLTHIGVRAHYWQTATDPCALNAVPVAVQQRVENPFHWDVLLRCGKNGQGDIWWKVPKAVNVPSNPTHIAVAPEDILLLCKN